MIRLHYSNRLEKLIGPLARAVDEAQSRNPLRRIIVVVPNRAVAEFLKLRLAEREGVAANLNFPFLRRYLARLIARAEPTVGVLDAEELAIAIFECLRARVRARDPEFAEVEAYLSDLPDGSSQRELRLFQLAGRMARLMREYSITRRPMLKRWVRGLEFADSRFSQSERWQRRLYLSLFDRSGALRLEWLANPSQRWMLLPDAFDAVGAGRLKDALEAPLHVFGLAYVGPEFVRMFSKLGEAAELHIYALNPCLEFWEDVESGYQLAAEQWARRAQRVGIGPEASEDPFGLEAGADSLALRLWGRPGREYIRLLNELTECDFDEHFQRPSPHARPPTILERLQQSILLRQPEGAPNPGEPVRDDASIRFVACSSPRREVEAAASAIWSLIRADDRRKDGAPLRFHQIALLIPDAARDAYMAHVEGVFAEQHEIPLNLVNRRFNAETRVGEAVELMLRLPLGDFARDQVLHLLTHPAVTGALAHADPERWTRWCDSVGVYFGADGDAFAGTYVPPAMYHWDQAIRRLALGAFMAGEPSGESRVFRAADGCEYLPYETPQEEAESLATLVRAARRLLADALSIRSRRLTLARWAALLGEMVNTHIHPPDAAGQAALDAIVREIASMAPAELRSDPVSYEVACNLALERIAEAESEYVRWAESGVAVGTLSAMRSIPFRIIFVLGLGETAFAGAERKDLLDLRLARRRAGDVSPSERDRYLFLETILAARERIFLSYVGRNAVTGNELEPSAVVRELQLMLRSWLDEPALKRLTLSHPVSRYDRRYFPDLAGSGTAPDDLMESVDANAWRGARASVLRENLASFSGNPPAGVTAGLPAGLKPEVRAELSQMMRQVEPPASSGAEASLCPEIVLPIAALRRFLECPIQGAARYALGMIDDGEDGSEDSENEPLTEDFLVRTVMLREALWSGHYEPEEVERRYHELFRLHQLAGRAPAGAFADAVRAADLEKLDLAAKQAAQAGLGSLAQWLQIRIGGADEFARVDRIVAPIVLEVQLPRPGGRLCVRVKLQGRVGPVASNLGASIRCVAGKNAKARDFLEGFLGAIALAAGGERLPPVFSAFALGGSQDQVKRLVRRFHPPNAEQAREYLQRLATELLSAENHYFMPIEAVESVVKEKRKDSRAVAAAISRVRDDERQRCSSDWGPVRDARLFPLPEPDEALALIERRFLPIMEIFAP